MPGPMLVLPPLKVGFIDSLTADLAAAWRQNRHPVYNAAGQNVGSYATLDALCQGQWFLNAGAVKPPPSQLYVVDFWGRKVPLSTQCVRSAQATAAGGSIVHPQAVQAASAAVAVQAANKAATGDPAPVDLDAMVAAAVRKLELEADPTSRTKYGTYAIWAGGAVLAGLLIFGGDRSPRRR